MICIIDYGMGNVKSVQNAILKLGGQAEISSDAHKINSAEGLILPGVGAFGVAMDNLKSRSLIEVLKEQVLTQKKPILGVCLGMQLFATHSTELGNHKGLDWIPGDVDLLDSNKGKLQIPHVGWNNVEFDSQAGLFEKLTSESHFYFDHSFHFKTDKKYVLATAKYGEDINAIVKKENIIGVQFHPEKSQGSGLKLLRGFLNYVEKENHTRRSH